MDFAERKISNRAWVERILPAPLLFSTISSLKTDKPTIIDIFSYIFRRFYQVNIAFLKKECENTFFLFSDFCPRARAPPRSFLQEKTKKGETNMGNKYHVRLQGGKVVEVSEEVYRAIKQPQWREKKRQIVRQKKEVSLEALEEKGNILYEDRNQASIEETIIRNIVREQLMKAFAKLSNEERLIIYGLYFDEKSEREVARMMGISQAAIHKRRNRILEKLKKFVR